MKHIKCEGCGKKVKEVCGDGYCRSCHRSIGFDECVDGSWVERMAGKDWVIIG